MKKQMHRLLSLMLSLILVVGLIPGTMIAHAATAAGTEIEAVSFTYTGYAEGGNVADAVVTCNTAGVDFTYKWKYLDSGGSYSDATKLSAQFISGIEYTLWIYFKAQDGVALAELNKTDVTLGGNNPVDVFTDYTIDKVNYSYGIPFFMSPLGGVTKYTVCFYTQGGKIGDESYRVERVTGTDGKLAAEQVPTPTKEHYIFAGWYTAESGGTLLSLDTVYTNSRSEYYARWVPTVGIDVTFDANGGKVNGKDTDTITIPVADKGKLASLPVPTREGYTFDGWYTAASGGMKITETTVFSEATTVYALWGTIDSVSFSYTGYAEGGNVADAVVTCNTAGVDFTYKWKYLDSGGSYSDATKLSAQFISGIEYTLWIYFKAQDGSALAKLNKTDVTLGGNNPVFVYTNYTIDEVNYSYGIPFSMSPLGGVTKYIVGFYTQGGKIGDESYCVERVTGTDGKLAAEQVPTPTKEHYIFAGWYTAESGGTLLSLDTVYTNSRNEYYARWAPTVDIYVTFDANGGTGTMADVTGISGEYTLPANGFTAPAGKQFKAWSVGGVEKAAGDTITVNANTTVTAIWDAVEYNVTVTGGTASVGAGTPITKATMGTTVTLTAGAAPTGQMFDKWVVNGVVVADANSATTTFVMPAGNVTAEATYDNSVPHTHNLTLVDENPATCTTPGNKAYYTCDGCDKWFEDATGSVDITDKTSVILTANGHTPSDWKSDADNHWKECTRCGDKTELEAHDFGTDNECDICGYKKAAVPSYDDDDDDYVSSTKDKDDMSGRWIQNEHGWWYSYSNGTWPSNGWAYLPWLGSYYWYYFNADGYMAVNWLDWNNNRYYLNPVAGTNAGMMLTGWQQIGGKWYFFNPEKGSLEGILFRNTTTPDGYQVSADGAWIQ